MKPKFVAIVQARMGSNRLPGKVMLDVEGKPLIFLVMHRLSLAKTIDAIVLATTDSCKDDVLSDYCHEQHWICYRGSENDVLDRFYQAALLTGATVVVRITADCPLLDPEVVDKTVRAYEAGECEYVSNALEFSYPEGLDVEVFGITVLEQAWREARLKSEREHVTSYIWNHPESFKLRNVKCDRDLSTLRWTVDKPEDMEFVRRIYQLMRPNINFGTGDVLKLLQEHPELNDINSGTLRGEGYRKSLKEDAVASPVLDAKKS